MLLFLAVLLCAAGIARGQEKPVLYWPYFNLPPQFVITPAGPVGMGIDAARELQKELPGYRHVFIHASPQRIEEELRSGRDPIVVSGLPKTPEREEYALFSETICRLTFSLMVVMRREDAARLAPDGKISLACLAADPNLSFGYLPGVNYGSLGGVLTPIVNNASTSRTFAAHEVGQLFDLLVEKRIDWFVHDSMGIWFAASDPRIGDRIAMVQALECPPSPIRGYFACSKKGQGPALMARINQAMDKLVSSRRLYNVLKGWIPPEFDDTFERAYADCVPAREDCPVHRAACRMNSRP